jgi:hypothetical protein
LHKWKLEWHLRAAQLKTAIYLPRACLIVPKFVAGIWRAKNKKGLWESFLSANLEVLWESFWIEIPIFLG